VGEDLAAVEEREGTRLKTKRRVLTRMQK